MNKYNLYIDYISFDGKIIKIVRAYKIFMYDVVKVLKTLNIDNCYRITISPSEED